MNKWVIEGDEWAFLITKQMVYILPEIWHID